MLQPIALCDSTDTQSGASVVTIIFLVVFTVLIAADAYISQRALSRTLDQYRVEKNVKETAVWVAQPKVRI